MSYLERSLTTLKNNGFKLTTKRKKALAYIQCHHGVFSPYDFVATYPEAQFDKVTLYRFFDLLTSLHLLQKIHSLNGYVRIDGCGHTDRHQHYFLVCPDCHTCEEKVFADEKLHLHTMGMFPKNKSLELVGCCQDCTTKQKTSLM